MAMEIDPGGRPSGEMLVRLKSYEPRRGAVLRRFGYRGITFHVERGWYRVSREVAEHLRTVRQVPGDESSPLAFDVCTEEEAKVLEERQEAEARVARRAAEAIQVQERHERQSVQAAMAEARPAVQEAAQAKSVQPPVQAQRQQVKAVAQKKRVRND